MARWLQAASWCLGVFLISVNALAWKPFTHINLADKARDEAVANGGVIINGRTYPLRTELLQAITAFPSFYDGGVIGPDGMPDIAFGQAVIHPTKSGEWIRRIL